MLKNMNYNDFGTHKYFLHLLPVLVLRMLRSEEGIGCKS